MIIDQDITIITITETISYHMWFIGFYNIIIIMLGILFGNWHNAQLSKLQDLEVYIMYLTRHWARKWVKLEDKILFRPQKEEPGLKFENLFGVENQT